jgi:hypothetical protein
LEKGKSSSFETDFELQPQLTCPTCLFTNQVLGPETELEHTIQRALGGRIKSPLVSCNEFNHRCGEAVDKKLVSVYAVHMNVLAPLLTSEHQPACLPVNVAGEPKGLVLDQGALTRRNCAILGRDDNGRPNSAIAPEIEPLQKLAGQIGLERWNISSREATQSYSFSYDCPAIRPEVELAALKSSLLTFDHLLQHDPGRFTRSEVLLPLREIIWKAVKDGRVEPATWHLHSLGMQYNRLPMYEQMRKHISLPKTPFEHLLLVAGN